MKSVKYFSMLLVVFVLISNGSCDRTSKHTNKKPLQVDSGRAIAYNVTRDSLSIEVSKDISMCDNDSMEMTVPNERLTAGGLIFITNKGRNDFRKNKNQKIYSDDKIIFPEISTATNEGLQAEATASFFSRIGLRLSGEFQSNEKISFVLQLKGTQIVTLSEPQIEEKIREYSEALKSADFTGKKPAIYKSIVYADGFEYQFYKGDSQSEKIKAKVSVDNFNAKSTGENENNVIKNEISNVNFGKKLAVLFCKSEITYDQLSKLKPETKSVVKINPVVETPITPKPSQVPKIKYKVILQDRGTQPEEVDEDSFHLKLARLVYSYEIGLENKPSDCMIHYNSFSGGEAQPVITSGFTGKIDNRLEGISLMLSRSCPSNWHINYKVNARNPTTDTGEGDWQPWACDGNYAGRQKGIQIVGLKFKITTNGECLR